MKLLMQGQQSGDVVSHPVLSAAYLPKKISPARQGAKLKGKFSRMFSTDVFLRVLELRGDQRNPRASPTQCRERALSSIALSARIEVSFPVR